MLLNYTVRRNAYIWWLWGSTNPLYVEEIKNANQTKAWDSGELECLVKRASDGSQNIIFLSSQWLIKKITIVSFKF